MSRLPVRHERNNNACEKSESSSSNYSVLPLSCRLNPLASLVSDEHSANLGDHNSHSKSEEGLADMCVSPRSGMCVSACLKSQR